MRKTQSRNVILKEGTKTFEGSQTQSVMLFLAVDKKANTF